MAEQLGPFINMPLDANGDPVALAEASWFEAGTSTPLTVYSDSALTTPHADPQVADADGVFAQVFIAAGTAAKVDIVDPDTAASLPGFPLDNVPLMGTDSQAGTNVTFTPITGNAATDVETAIGNNTAGQLLLENLGYAPTTAGSSNAFTVTLTNAPASYTTGLVVRCRADRAPTGASTMNVNGLGAKDIKRVDGANSLQDLYSTAWTIGAQISMYYDGTQFILQTPYRANASLQGLVEQSTSAENVAGTATDVYPDVAGVKEMIDTHTYAVLDDTTISTDADYTFTTISSTYNRYEVHLSQVLPATDGVGLWLRFSNDGGSTYEAGASYYSLGQQVQGTGSAGGAGDAADSEIQITSTGATNGIGTAAGEYGVSGVIEILETNSATLLTTARASLSYERATDGALHSMRSTGRVLTAEANDAFQLVLDDASNLTSGRIWVIGYTE